jgi:hypothetical protein
MHWATVPVHPNETRLVAPDKRASENAALYGALYGVGPKRLKYPTAESRRQAVMGFR